jgi:hypothetical protein
MASLIAIDPKLHRELRIEPEQAVQHGKSLHLLPGVLAEFNQLALQYPIVITKNSNTGRFLPVAMLGFKPGENLFWQQERWQGLYIPMQIRRQPFFVGEVGDQEIEQASEHNAELADGAAPQYTMCFDPQSPTISGHTGERLFTEEGEETEFYQQAKLLMSKILQGEADNEQFIEMLTEFELLQELSLELVFVDQSSEAIENIYGIDQKKLALLTGEQLAKLHSKNYLQAIFAMNISLSHIYSLINRKNTLLQDE